MGNSVSPASTDRNDNQNVRQGIGFLLVGGLSAAIDAGVFLLLTALGMRPWLATIISFLSAFVINYRGNRDLVFKAQQTPGTLPKYIALVAVNLVLSTLLVIGLIDIGMEHWFAKGISMVIIAVMNFFIMRLWVFRSQV